MSKLLLDLIIPVFLKYLDNGSMVLLDFCLLTTISPSHFVERRSIYAR